MTANECVRCERPTPNGYACSPCTEKARRHLAEIVELLPVALDVAYGQTSGGPAIGGGTYGPRVQLNLMAKAGLGRVEHELVTLARMVAEERGVAL